MITVHNANVLPRLDWTKRYQSIDADCKIEKRDRTHFSDSQKIMEDPLQSMALHQLHRNAQTPNRNHYQLFDPLDFATNNQEPHTFCYDDVNFDPTAPVAFDILDSDAFISFDNGETPPHLDDDIAHEGCQVSFDRSASDETFYGSPKSSRNSEESQSIIPEHYGPGCWLSVCSPSGLAWVQSLTGSDDFASIAADLTAAWTKQLRLERNEPTLRNREPEPEQAWKYSNGIPHIRRSVALHLQLTNLRTAYFERSVDSLFEVVHRPEFEWQLRGHLGKGHTTDDPACYALRNTVYASGCRLYHSASHAANFTLIQEEAWSYFSNALSVHSELLLRSPSLRAVRALLAMVSDTGSQSHVRKSDKSGNICRRPG
jgi:hypothetical protein